MRLHLTLVLLHVWRTFHSALLFIWGKKNKSRFSRVSFLHLKKSSEQALADDYRVGATVGNVQA